MTADHVVERTGTRLVARVASRLDVNTSPALEDALMERIDGVEELVFDLADCSYVSSMGLRVLLMFAKRMASQGTVRTINVCEPVWEIFEETGLTTIIGAEPLREGGGQRKIFDEVPRIEDERIVLKRMEPCHAEALRELVQNERVYRYEPTFLIERQFDDAAQAIEYLYEQPFRNKESLILGVFEKGAQAGEESFCGLAEFYGLKDYIHKISIGYRLVEHCWGRGIATNTVTLMLRFVQNETDIQLVTASTMVDNLASARVLQKNGFVRTAEAVPEDWGHSQLTLADKWFL